MELEVKLIMLIPVILVVLVITALGVYLKA